MNYILNVNCLNFEKKKNNEKKCQISKRTDKKNRFRWQLNFNKDEKCHFKDKKCLRK